MKSQRKCLEHRTQSDSSSAEHCTGANQNVVSSIPHLNLVLCVGQSEDGIFDCSFACRHTTNKKALCIYIWGKPGQSFHRAV